MKSKLSILPVFVVAISSVVLIAQQAAQNGRVDAGVSTNQPQRPPDVESAPIKDDPAGRSRRCASGWAGTSRRNSWRP